MKFLHTQAVLAFCTVCMFGVTQTAHAVLKAVSTVKWGDMEIQYVDLSDGTNTPQLTWTKQFGYASSDSYSNEYPYQQHSDYQQANDFTTPLSTNTPSSYAQSNATRNQNILQVNTLSNELHYPAYNYAQSDAHNFGTFSLSGYGSVRITLPWSQSISGGSLSNRENYAHASTFIRGYSFGEYSTYEQTILNSYSYNGDPSNVSGTFILEAFSDGTETVSGEFYVKTSAHTQASTIPDPATAWLFGSGLMMVFGYTRRKNRVLDIQMNS